MQDKEQQQAIDNYVDPIEQSEMDKFVCMEMGRQIHRYIKAMRGSVSMMYRFEEQLKTLTIPERETAIARYIDLNRKVVSGLDFRMMWPGPWPTIATLSTIWRPCSTMRPSLRAI